MYYPKHQIKRVSQDRVPPLQDSSGNSIKPLSVILTGDGKVYKDDTNALSTGNFNGVEQYFRVEQQIQKPNEKILTQQDIDYSKDDIKRYFLHNKSTNSIKELNKKDYLVKLPNSKNYETLAEINWRIKGPKKDTYIDDFLLEGAETINKRRVAELALTIPNITQKITDFGKFVQEVPTTGVEEENYKIDTDKFYIPSPSSR